MLAGRPLAQAMMMMIPAAYASRDDMPPELEAFYRYSSSVIEPWDGPAAMVFSDGRVLGACLDRNGLRPGRWLVTDEGVARRSAPRPACCRSTRPRSSAAAACTRAGC